LSKGVQTAGRCFDLVLDNGASKDIFLSHHLAGLSLIASSLPFIWFLLNVKPGDHLFRWDVAMETGIVDDVAWFSPI